MWTIHPSCVPHTVQVWGIASFIFFGFCQSLLLDRRNQLHTFFFIITVGGVDAAFYWFSIMKKIFLFAVIVIAMTSCSTLVSTSTHRDINVNAPLAVPVIADLDVSSEKIMHFYTPTMSVRAGGLKNVLNSAVRDALGIYGNADVLVGLETQINYVYFLFFKRIESVVITGYPASYKNFRGVDEKVWYETTYFQNMTTKKRVNFLGFSE